jgi:hypothetical protein
MILVHVREYTGKYPSIKGICMSAYEWGQMTKIFSSEGVTADDSIECGKASVSARAQGEAIMTKPTKKGEHREIILSPIECVALFKR